MYVHYTKMIFNQDFYAHSCLIFELILSIYSGVIQSLTSFVLWHVLRNLYSLKFLCHQKLIVVMPATMLHHKDGLESKMLSTNYYDV